MPRVIHFEIPSDKLERAVNFYKEAFGWEIMKWEGPVDYWLVTTGPDTEPGIDGRIMKRMEGQATTNTIGVPSVDEFIRKIIKAGGKVISQKLAIPGIGWQAYCLDTEGNAFGIHQFDPDAR